MSRNLKAGRAKVRSIVFLTSIVVIAFCLLSSIQDKHGVAIGLPKVDIPVFDKIYYTLDNLLEGNGNQKENALAVSTTPDGIAEVEVHFIDVGQGKSIFIKGPEKNVLIDAGEVQYGAKIVKYLRDNGVTKLDYIIATHPHSDHIGGFSDILDIMEVGEFVIPNTPKDLIPTTATYTKLLEKIYEKVPLITAAKVGNVLELGDGAVLKIIGPLANYQDLNNTSIITKLTYKDISFLFTGDAEKQSEEALVAAANIKANVLDVPHHGGATSSTEPFLEKVHSQYAVVSCGLDNSYNHPARSVVERLTALDSQIYRTDLNGWVLFVTDGTSLEISTEK